MLEWIEGIINQMGYLGIALLMALENIFPPIPSELIMPLAGFTAGRGDLSLFGVILAGMIGSVAGALPLYALGRWTGWQRVNGWVRRHGKWLLLNEDDMERVQGWFDRHGRAAVLLCRVIPGVRSLISIPAGVARMNFALFLLYTSLGTAVWAAFLAFAGNLLGENYQAVKAYITPAGYVVLAGMVLALVLRAVKQNRQARSS